MKVSTLIGTEIFSPSGEKLGYVKTVYLSRDRKKITCLMCVDETENEEDDEFVMPFRAVLAVKDVIIAKKQRVSKTTGLPAPVGINAYSDTGEALGTLSEILVCEEGPVYVLTKNGVNTLYTEDAVTVGEALMIKENAPANPVQGENGEVTAVVPVTDFPVVGETVPRASMGVDRLNLLGRQVKITVRDKNGDPIALSGERITPEILSRARKNNLLLRLTVNTLTNII